MKVLRILFSIVMVAFALSIIEGKVMAASVTIKHGGGILTGTLSGLNVDANGDVILTVTENLTGGCGTCTNNRPTISVTNPPTTATVGTQISAQFTTSDSDGQNVTVKANYGSVSGNTWSWTPSQTGTYTIKLTADDGQNCNNTAEDVWSINVSNPTGGGGNEPKGVVTLQKGVWTRGFNLPGYGTLYFKATLDSPCSTTSKQLRIKTSGYAAGSNPDMLVKKSNHGTESWPTYEDYILKLKQYGYNRGQFTDGKFFWNFASAYEGEINIIYSDVPGGQADTYYIFLYNNSSVGTQVDMYYYCY